ncbi:hypothetical protein F0U60_09060 [Archangium minus]|uniref:Uncharacterized protein n=1 Tax=Archangium minus TaxID=83450 RepID=A0ABY9WKV2_9BACT|nr:hypothetical protein F0U60_09060 [Archangium minus]
MLEEKILRNVVPAKAMPRLKDMLCGYMSHWSRVYIGATAHPEIRYGQHMNDGWHKMVLLYEAFSPEIALGMERELIAYARQTNFLTLVENINPGGEGLSHARRSNYLYLLCG